MLCFTPFAATLRGWTFSLHNECAQRADTKQPFVYPVRRPVYPAVVILVFVGVGHDQAQAGKLWRNFIAFANIWLTGDT